VNLQVEIEETDFSKICFQKRTSCQGRGQFTGHKITNGLIITSRLHFGLPSGLPRFFKLIQDMHSDHSNPQKPRGIGVNLRLHFLGTEKTERPFAGQLGRIAVKRSEVKSADADFLPCYLLIDLFRAGSNFPPVHKLINLCVDVVMFKAFPLAVSAVMTAFFSTGAPDHCHKSSLICLFGFFPFQKTTSLSFEIGRAESKILPEKNHWLPDVRQKVDQYDNYADYD
jgi:hypothetical protein